MHAHGAELPILSARVLERAAGAGCLFIDLCEIPPGAGVGLHAHGPDDEEIYVVVTGTGTMSLDDAVLAVGPGDVIVNRPGGTHSLTNDGDDVLRLVVVDVAAPGPAGEP